ncbi:MAG: PorT family protein [Ignavibacteria bacterium]|nr:PorT family protein [Ignavibacteria bacterium]
MKNLIFHTAKVLVILTALTVNTMLTSAQSVDLSFRVLHTFSSFDIQSSSNTTTQGTITLGHGFAGIAHCEFSKHIGMQAEIIYSSSSHLFKEEDVERRIDITYIHVPIMMVFNTGTSDPVNIHFTAGPQFGLLVGSSMSTTGGNGKSNEGILAMRNTDLGIAYGVGIDVGIDPLNILRLSIGFRGTAGLTSMGDSDKPLPPNSYYLLGESSRDTYSGYIGLVYRF